jgi:hypothetical protein
MIVAWGQQRLRAGRHHAARPWMTGLVRLTPATCYITRNSEQQGAIESDRPYIPSPLEKKLRQEARK